MNLLKYSAYSKINLGLQVLNRREDGYHNINTVFFLTDLYDEIEFERADNIEILTTPELYIPLEDNLIYKAGKLFLESNNIKNGFRAVVNKMIPTGGGLGGGSSDAAITVIALDKMFGTNLPQNSLMEIVSRIGSDCPFFLSGSPAAIGKGKGEILQPINLKLNCKTVIVNPGIHVSTPMAYKMLERENKSYPETDFGKILTEHSRNPKNFRDLLYNDFEDVIFRLHPEIAEIKHTLYNIGANFALMSGSGSTVFGLFPEEITLSKIQAAFPGYFCFVGE